MSTGEKAMAGLVGFCVLLWFFGQPTPKPQPEIPTSSTELMAQVESVQDNFVDANEMTPPAPSPSDKPHEKIKRKILVFVAPKGQRCEPCERWKRCEMQRFMDADWDVAIFDEKHSYGLTPTFEITSGETTVTRSGYTTLEQAAEAVR